MEDSGFVVGKLEDDIVPEGRGEAPWNLASRVVPEIGETLGFSGCEVKRGSDRD